MYVEYRMRIKFRGVIHLHCQTMKILPTKFNIG